VTEPNEIDEMLRDTRERLERLAKMVPARALTLEELTKMQISMYRVVLTLSAKVALLKVMVDDWKTHEHVEDNTNVADDQDTPEATD